MATIRVASFGIVDRGERGARGALPRACFGGRRAPACARRVELRAAGCAADPRPAVQRLCVATGSTDAPLYQSLLQGTGTRDAVVTVLIFALFGLLPVAAEVVALSATMNGGIASDLETWLVAGVVTYGMWAVTAVIVWPWIHPVWRLLRVAKAGFSVTLASMLALTVWALSQGVQISERSRLWSDRK